MTAQQDTTAIRCAEQSGAGFAPWTLVRVAGLPADTCELVSSQTAKHLERWEELATALPSVGEPVVNACYDLVPSLDDQPDLRRLALAVKRAAHNGTGLPGNTEDLVALLPAPAVDALADYRAHTAELTRLREELTEAVAADSERTRASFVAQLGHEPFVRSLAIAAPEWARYGLAKARKGRLDARNLRTLYSYVTRTALKTSPFARLTTVALPGVASSRTQSYAGAAVAYTALHAAARDRVLAHALRYRVAPHTSDAPGGFVVHGQGQGLGRLPWLAAEIAHDAAAPAWLFTADDDRDHLLDELLALLGGADPWTRYLRVLDSGWVHPVACWKPGVDPLDSLLSAFDTAEPDHPLTRQVRLVRHVAHEAAGCAAPERITALATVGQAQEQWRAASGLRMWTPDLVYEDCASGFAAPDPFDAGTGLELASFAETVRPHVFRSHVYDFLLERFVSRFGHGGVCGDVLGFFAELTVEDRTVHAIEELKAKDLAVDHPGERAFLPVGLTSAPPTTAMFVQSAHSDGDPLLVVNQFGSGTGGLVGRFTGLLGHRLSDAMTEWFSALWPAMPRYEVIPSRACTTAQHAASGLLPALTVPGDGVAGRLGDLPLARTTLVHNPAHDVLELLGPGGHPIGLANLGLVPAALSSGVHRLLLTLADPWMPSHRYGDNSPFRPLPQSAIDSAVDGVIALPRRTVGRTVVERAAWLCSVDRLPLPHKGESESDTVLRMNRWRLRHGIPAQVFCRRSGEVSAKPLWADLRSAVSLAVLRQELPEDGGVRLTEALPAPHEHTLVSPAGERLAGEYVIGLRWPRPGGRS